MRCFADDPSDYFGGRSSVAHHLPLEEREAIQLEGLQQRLAELRDAILPLGALADAARIEQVRVIEDAAPLLFPHSFYKSFPQHLIHARRFDALVEWLSRLTTNDLGAAADGSFDSIDAWMDALDARTELEITHSSGTTGALSLYPRGKRETALQAKLFPMTMSEWLDPLEVVEERPEYAVIWPTYPDGRSAILKGAGMFRNIVAADPALFLALMPGPMSSDWQIYVLEVDGARSRGEPPPPPSAYVEQKMAEAEEAHRLEADRVNHLLDTLRVRLASHRIVMAGGPGNLHRISIAGLEKGMEPGFAPGSIVRTFGGLKGFAQPENMEATIKRFAGVDRIGAAYGMTEVLSQFSACELGNFHVPPWVVPMALDPDSGAVRPRQGRQRGRAAFVDLLPRTYWGGVVSADVVEIDWERCGCGRTSPHVRPNIARIAASGSDEHAIGAASDEAIHAALHALTWGL